MPTRILDSNTGTVYLPDKVGYPDPKPELNSVTFMTEAGSVHTVHYHSSWGFDTPMDVVNAHYDGTLTTDPKPDDEQAQEQQDNRDGGY